MITIERQFQIALDKADKEHACVIFICNKRMNYYLKQFLQGREGIWYHNSNKYQSKGFLRLVDVITAEETYHTLAGYQLTHVFVANPAEDNALSFLQSRIRSASYAEDDMGIYLPDGYRCFWQYNSADNKNRMVKEEYCPGILGS